MRVMPIKRDKAMAALTDTEIAVLEMLSKEGRKNSTRNQGESKLSREHTARLMKKLYEEGYLGKGSRQNSFQVQHQERNGEADAES